MVLWKVFITVCTPSLMVSSLTSLRYDPDELISSFTRPPILSFQDEHSKRRSSRFLSPTLTFPSGVYFCFIAPMWSSCLHAYCYLAALCAVYTVCLLPLNHDGFFWCICVHVCVKETDCKRNQTERKQLEVDGCASLPTPLWILFSS